MKEVIKIILEKAKKRDLSKYMILGVICLVLISFLMVSKITTTGFVVLVNSAQDEGKISEEVYEKLNEGKEVSVILKTKTEKKFLGIKFADVEDIKEDIIKELKEDLDKEEIRDYQDLISIKVSEQELQELEQNPNIEEISYSHPIKAFLQDSVPLINASDVWSLQSSGINITGIDETICVIDSGINFSHPDLIGKNKTCTIDCYNKNCIENCSISDDYGHGTHVAGIVAGNIGLKGVAIESDLIGVKVLDENGNGHGVTAETDLTNSIDWCIQNRDLYNISVITMSLGTAPPYLYDDYCDSTFTNTWTKSINNASFYNISVIVATGNNLNSTHISAPSCVQNATSVGATTKNDKITGYSNRNSITDLFAPGGNITSKINSTNVVGGYVEQYGTSMATPHVAGAFALIKQLYRIQEGIILTPLQIQNLLNSTGKQVNDASGNGLNFSIINVYDAVNSIINTSENNTLTINFSISNNTYTNQNQTFICNSTSNSELINTTFYIWNSTSLVYNLTNNISGEFNSTEFDYNFSIEDSYLWNCVSYNNQSFSNSNENYTIIYDATIPNITLINPTDSSSYTSNSQSISFSYNVSDTNLNNCSLIIDNVVDLTNSSINQSLTQSFTKTFSSGTYNWKINCSDLAENQANSSQRSFTVTAVVVSDDSSSSSGGSSGGSGGSTTTEPVENSTVNDTLSIYKTYPIETEEIINGYTKELERDDKIKFNFEQETQEHTITAEEIGEDFVNLIIESDIVKLRLEVGEEEEISLDSNKLYIKLNNITEQKASITIKITSITQEEIAPIVGQAVGEGITLSENIKTGIFFSIIVIVFIIVIFGKKSSNKKIEDIKKEYRAIFRKMKPKRKLN